MMEYMTAKEISELLGKSVDVVQRKLKELGITSKGKETRLTKEQSYSTILQFLSPTQLIQLFKKSKLRDIDIVTSYIVLLDRLFCTNYDLLSSTQRKDIITILEKTLKLFDIDRTTKLNDPKKIKETLLIKAKGYSLIHEHCLPEDNDLSLYTE